MPGWFVDFGRYAGGLLAFSLAAAFSALALVPCVALFQLVDAHAGLMWAVMCTPFLYLVWGTGLAVLTVAFKRLSMYRPSAGEYPLFSANTIGWALSGYLTNWINTWFMVHWKGTPYLNWYLRGMGAHIGHRVNINTVLVFDWDLITIEDDVVLGGDCVVQGHLLESGKLKMRAVRIGKGALIGTRAKVMPGCDVGNGAVVGAESMLTKGAQVPAQSIFAGTPAKLIRMRGEKDREDTGLEQAAK